MGDLRSPGDTGELHAGLGDSVKALYGGRTDGDTARDELCVPHVFDTFGDVVEQALEFLPFFVSLGLRELGEFVEQGPSVVLGKTDVGEVRSVPFGELSVLLGVRL